VTAPQSVQRIFQILLTLASRPDGESLAGLAKSTGAPKTSLVGLLAGMVEGGYVIRDEPALYRTGPNMFLLATHVVGAMKLPVLAQPFLERLMNSTGETALAGSLASDADILVYVQKVESPNPVRYTVPVGERRELYASAMGKLFLAYMAPKQRNAYLRTERFQAFTANTLTTAATLRAQLDEIRSEGLSKSSDERVMGAGALAAPVFNSAGELVLGIGIAGPTERMLANRRAHSRIVVQEAKALSKLFAGIPAGQMPTA
jgi:IclR family transcriptional regulator, acetate operon repressor